MDSRLRRHPLGFWEIAVRPSQPELKDYYARKYYQEARGSYELDYTEDELAYFRGKLEQRFAMLTRYRGSSVGTLLDVGCGEGFALAFFRSKGWVVKGLDFSSAGAQAQNPSCLDAIVCGDVFESLQSEIAAGRKYAVVWLQNVLEHVVDPIELLVSIRGLLGSNGIAVITVPNDCSITQRAALECNHIESAFWVAPPDHLSYFDYTSLSATAVATGWRCLDVLADFPIDWFLFHPESNFIRDRTRGKAAHRARVVLENLIHKQSRDDVLEFWSAAARVGLGRNITAFLQPVARSPEERVR